GLLGSRVKETHLSELQGAKVEPNPMDNDAFRVVLLTPNGKIPFTSSTSGNQKNATVTASNINTFIGQDEEPKLKVDYDERVLYCPMGASIIAFGLFTLAFSKTVRPHF